MTGYAHLPRYRLWQQQERDAARLGGCAADELRTCPCPKCGKPEGVLKEGTSGRFRYYVAWGACTLMTDPARTEAIAMKLWNEAKCAAREKRG